MKKRKLINLFLTILLAGCLPVKAVEQEPEEDPGEYVCRKIDSYDYESAAGWSDPADDAYYSDSLFAGDSRMGSLYLYGTHENAEVKYVTSLNLLMIDSMGLDEEELSEEQKESEEKITLLDVLRDTKKNNIYLMFGINEIRNLTFEYYEEALNELVVMLRENNPQCDVYIILSYHPDEIGGLPEPDLSDQLEALNRAMREVAVRNHVYYLNLDDGLNDEEGTIIDDYVYDGLHFTPEGTRAFEDYVGSHIVWRNQYVKESCE